MTHENETALEEIWVVVADIYNDEDSILEEQVKTSEEEAHQFIRDMGNTTLKEERLTEKRIHIVAVYEQEIEGTIKDIHIVRAYRNRRSIKE